MSQSPSLAAFDRCAADLARVEAILEGGVRSNLDLPRELSQRLVLSGGKRIRPLLLCLARLSLARPGLTPRAGDKEAHMLAAVAEWVHTATLFHDDVLDASPERRGQAAAQVLHGNKVAILVGDFVYAEAFARLMDCGLLECSKTLATTIQRLVEGELLQHRICLDRSCNTADYDRVAHAKTASLFGWCTGSGAWVAGVESFEAAGRYGEALGYAFQMADDLLDTFELNPHAADPSLLKEWILSAPPLPVVLAASEIPAVAALWASLDAEADVLSQRRAISELQRLALDPRVVTACQARIRGALATADDCLRTLGAEASPLAEAAQWIRARAEQGFEAVRGREEQLHGHA
jgi:octaprenyl-diphosphate synthase